MIQSSQIRIAILMTCYNRRDVTLRCLRELKAQQDIGAVVDLFVVDDGSTDGTRESVSRDYPKAHILQGNGSLFWGGGMRLAFSSALSGDYDFYLWLNDDVILQPDALQRLLSTHAGLERQTGMTLIVVGSMRDSLTGVFTYGGWRGRRGRLGTPSWEKTPPDAERSLFCETFNGNCVLIPRGIARHIGNLDAAFTHVMGDLDYGLRVSAMGYRIAIMPGYAGECCSNEELGQWTDQHLSLVARWRALLGPKGLPLREWGVFCWRHKGLLWPLVWLGPYVRFWGHALMHSIRSLR